MDQHVAPSLVYKQQSHVWTRTQSRDSRMWRQHCNDDVASKSKRITQANTEQTAPDLTSDAHCTATEQLNNTGLKYKKPLKIGHNMHYWESIGERLLWKNSIGCYGLSASVANLKPLILAAIDRLLILRLAWRHKRRVLRPRREGYPHVVQYLKVRMCQTAVSTNCT